MPVVPRLLLLMIPASGCFFQDPGVLDSGAGSATSTTTGEVPTTGEMPTTGEASSTGEVPTTGGPPEQCGWEMRSPQDRPAARIEATLTLDEQSGRLVLFGGRIGLNGADLGDTWEFDGSNWKRIEGDEDEDDPGPRRSHAAAWDSARGQVVLFGGEFGAVDVKFAESTWLRDGATWSERKGGGGPSPRSHATMADLPGRQRVVLFGGRGKDKPNNETWLWDGGGWAKAEPADAPSPRFDHAMALDEASGQILLHGGCPDLLCGMPLPDTWAYDGETWTKLTTAESPGPRAGGMAYDRSEPALLRFGDGKGFRWGETWSTVEMSAHALGAFAIAYHPGTAGLVLFGGVDAKLFQLDDTWVFRCAR